MTTSTDNVIIDFICDVDGGIGSPEFLKEVYHYATLYFVWMTIVACPISFSDPGVPSPPCEYTVDGAYYNLGSLDTDVAIFSSFAYYFNVCSPMKKVLGGTCLYGVTHVCQVENAAFSCGDVLPSAAIALPNSQGITLKFTGGEPCSLGPYRTSIFNIVCGSSQKNPTFVGETSACTYEFEWITPAGCPTVKPPPTTAPTDDPASDDTENPSTNAVIIVAVIFFAASVLICAASVLFVVYSRRHGYREIPEGFSPPSSSKS